MIEARGYKLVRDDPSVYRRTVCGRSTITTSSVTHPPMEARIERLRAIDRASGNVW
jgi:Zn-dependent protease with chaperone function